MVFKVSENYLVQGSRLKRLKNHHKKRDSFQERISVISVSFSAISNVYLPQANLSLYVRR